MACADKAKTITGEVIDEATSLLSTMQRLLKAIEDLMVNTGHMHNPYTHALLWVVSSLHP